MDMQIIDITLPTMEEMDGMSLEELCGWRKKLLPFYYDRFEISERYEFEQYKKTIRFLWFEKMVKNIKNGVNRWEGVSNRK